MPRGVPVHPEQRAKVLSLHAAGKGRNAIVTETGVSSASVSRIVADAGESFDRSKTESAVQARRIDRAAVRADIIDRLYLRTQKLLTRLEADTFTHRVQDGDGTSLVSDEWAPADDEKNLSAAMVNYLKQARELEAADQGTGSPIESMLGRLAMKFGLTDD